MTSAGAIQPFSPFDVTGFLEQATFGDCPGTCGGTDPLAGGTLTVNGELVIVPRNTIVLLPATAMTWKELFDKAPPPYLGLHQSGLALNDGSTTAIPPIPPPLAAYEVHVQGNRVNGVNIAGLVNIAQHSLMTGQGFITFIDYVTGEFRVGGVLNDPNCQQGVANPACSGQRVKINDPEGKFGRAWSPDTRFTIDEDNPTVRAATGFPMCIPRDDPGAGAGDALCPQTNRPRAGGVPLTIFTMPDPALGVPPRAHGMAPFAVGDYVTYAGLLVRDGPLPTAGSTVGPTDGRPLLPANVLPPGGTKASPATAPLVAPLTNAVSATNPGVYVAAHAVVGNLGIFTAPGTSPAYVAIDVTILGVGGIAVPGFPQEATTRTRFEGFTTDPTRTINLWGMDVDPCTGAEVDRNWGSSVVDPGPPTGAVLGRWRFRPPASVLTMPTAGVFLPATREVRASIAGYSFGPVTPAGLVAGQYHAPISAYLFPEQLAPGNPPVALTLNEFPFLMNGSGPWPGAGGAIVGRLVPAPWDPALNGAATSCGTPPVIPRPTAVASFSPATVSSGTVVTLLGAASTSNTTPPQPLAFQWSQTGPASGPFVALSNPTVASPTFTAPIVAAATSLTFLLTVSDLGGTSTATVTVPVNPVANPRPPIAALTAPASVFSGATVTLNATGSSDPNTPPTALSYAYAQTAPASPLVAITPAGNTASFKAPVVTVATAFTFKVTVTNGLGLATASAPVTVTVNPASPPVVQPVPAQAVLSAPPAGVVTLTGAATDPQGLPLTYTWSQTGGPAVALTPGGPSTSPIATFPKPTLPSGSAPVVYTFRLSVTNGVTTPVAVTTTVTVSAPDVVTITSVTYRTGIQRLTVTATSSATGGITMSFHVATPAPGGTTVPMTVVTTAPLTFTGTLNGTPNPDPTGGVTVTSSLGGTATSLVTTLRP
ncbi:MAG TPA: hypothetical protein VFP65_03095 [Anaeromyxobacteraceae bacterium]|nr:hypothetical protein [Anaeromyxobacteraceae bacterium]